MYNSAILFHNVVFDLGLVCVWQLYQLLNKGIMGYPFTEIYFKSYIEKRQIAKYSNSLFSTEYESRNEMKIYLKMSS